MIKRHLSRKVQIEHRRDRVMQLALQGGSVRRIADALSKDKEHPIQVSPRQVALDIQHRLDESAKDNQNVERYRTRQLIRLESLLNAWWPRAHKPVEENGHVAVQCVRGILQDMTKLLGLNEPTRIAIGGDKKSPPIKVETVNRIPELSRLSLDQLKALRDIQEAVTIDAVSVDKSDGL